MIEGLDHVSIVVADLPSGEAAYAAFLGVTAERRAGQAWLRTGNVALGLTAGEAEGLAGLTFRVDALSEAGRRLDRRGVPSLAVRLDERETIRLDPGATHGIAIALAGGPDAPPPTTGDIEGLDHVVIATPNPERAVAFWGGRLGLDLRLDRSNPAWGARQLFFRCGDLVVEVAARLDAPITDAPDRLSGLAWRARDPIAARARIAAAGFDVSPVRAGRKPGTAVFTLRSGLAGAPSLVIGPG